MVNPVPTFRVTTAWGIRGRHWSCNRNSAGHGVHTGADYAAPNGTRVVAARPGVVRHVNFGSAFGPNQVLIVVDASAGGGGDFYAHMRVRRTTNGGRVAAGQAIGEVGALGNATGPHLHFERHRTPGSWNCNNHVNPQPSHDWQPPPTTPTTISHGTVRLPMRSGDANSNSVRRLQMHLNDTLRNPRVNLPLTGNFLSQTDAAVIRFQREGSFSHIDTPGNVRVRSGVAEALFSQGCGCKVVDDR